MKKNNKINSIVIASHNQGKIKEMLPFVKKISNKIHCANDFNLKEPKEDGSTFIENALKKSRYVNSKTKKISIADDSGLVIPSLRGMPGIYSSRWAGEKKDFKLAMKKIHKLLYKKKQTLITFLYLQFHGVKIRKKYLWGKYLVILLGLQKEILVSDMIQYLFQRVTIKLLDNYQT